MRIIGGKIETLIGWFNNYLAIKLLFRPYKDMYFFFFKIQGLIPKRRDEISENIADVVEKELISVDDIENKLKEVEFDDGMIEKVLDKLVEEKLKKSIFEKNPLFKMIINDSMVDKIKKYFKNMILENKDEILSEMIKIGKEKIDFKEIILEKMKNFSLEEIEKIILSISKNELKHIEIIGGFLGGLIAVFQFLFMVLLKQI